MQDETEQDKSAQPVSPSEVSPEAQKNAKERFYDKIPLSVKQLDVIIILVIAAIAAILIIGTLIGNGIIDNPIPARP